MSKTLPPVGPEHVLEMAGRISFAARKRALAFAGHPGADLPYDRAVARHERRHKALARLVRALDLRIDYAYHAKPWWAEQ